MERELPSDAAVLSVDEHTALVLDLQTQDAEVLGRGGATVRKAGVSTVLPAGSRISLHDLRALVTTGTAGQGSRFGQEPAAEGSTQTQAGKAAENGQKPQQASAVGESAELPEITRDV